MARGSPTVRVEVLRALDPARTEAVWLLLKAVSETQGHPPLGEHRWLDLVQGGRGARAAVLAYLEGHDHGPVGYAQLSGSVGNWSIDLAVHPHHRLPDPAATSASGQQVEPDPIALALLEGAIAEAASAGGGHLHLWIPKPTSVDDATAEAAGLSKGRDLYQLRRPLPLEPSLAEAASGLAIRPFRVGVDEKRWLEVNNRAFSWHPEQGGWTIELLAEREAESWFDPEGLLMHEQSGRLAGFCWTKIHSNQSPPLGEIYVIAVDPDFQGRGLGRSLAVAGLEYLASRGLGIGMLYVDATNRPALALYGKLGFSLDHVDRAYVGDV
jgi:mycothiol synthase